MNLQLINQFHQPELRSRAKRVLEAYQENQEESDLPAKDYIKDDGEGNETFILDVPAIEDSFLYALEEERDADYQLLMQLIDTL